MKPGSPVPKLGLSGTKRSDRILPHVDNGPEVETWQKIMKKEHEFLLHEEHSLNYQAPFHFFTKEEYQEEENTEKQKVSVNT